MTWSLFRNIIKWQYEHHRLLFKFTRTYINVVKLYINNNINIDNKKKIEVKHDLVIV